MVRSAFTLILLFVVFTGCNSDAGSTEQQSGANSKKVSSSRISLQVTKTDKDSLIVATVTAGSQPDSIELDIEQPFQRIHVVINDVKTDSLQASLRMPGTGRNLRINQIVTADGTMDGPFGHEIHYATPRKGTYTLVIGKDNMADGQVQGPVTVYLKLF